MRFLLGFLLVVSLAWVASRWKDKPRAAAPVASTPILAAPSVISPSMPSDRTDSTAPALPGGGAHNTAQGEDLPEPEAGADPALRARRDAEELELRELRAQAEKLSEAVKP